MKTGARLALAVTFLAVGFSSAAEVQTSSVPTKGAATDSAVGATPVTPSTAEPQSLPAASTTPLQLFQPVASDSLSDELNLLTGKSTVITSPEPLKRVSVTDPAIASATIVTPNQVLIHAHLPGAVSLILWNEQESIQSFELVVEMDVEALQKKFDQVLTHEQISASASGSSVILTGTVSSAAAAERAVALAQTHSETVVNMLDEQSEQVMLHVRFAEVDRAAVRELGFSIFGTGAANTPAAISTGQFGQTLANIGALPSDLTRGRDPDAPNLISGSKQIGLAESPSVFGVGDLLNIFLFRPDINVGVAVRALQQRNLLEILAEPNLVAQNGKNASFVAGGEFPFPVVQGISGGLPSITVQFREFGIRLGFTPHVANDGTIALKIQQEVSALDFGNALTVSGFVVPALSTRKAETEVQLRDGQSFAIAGLIDNRMTEVASKIPWLGDIPVLGKFFQSKSLEKSNQELLVLVTPEVLRPTEVATIRDEPEFPEPFMKPEEFDEDDWKNWPWDASDESEADDTPDGSAGDERSGTSSSEKSNDEK